MRALLVLVLGLSLVACGGDDGNDGDDAPVDSPQLEDNATLTVTHYDYEIDLESRAVSVRLTLDVTVDGRCVMLSLRNANVDHNTVRIDDTALSSAWGAASLFACKPDGTGGIGVGEHVLTATITQQPLERWGQSQVGYTVTPDGVLPPNTQSYYYLISWIEGCDRFGPCDTRPGTFARYRFTIHHRSGVRALCPGTVTTTDTTTVCDFDHDGGPTYSTFGFIAYAGWTETSRGAWDGIDVTLYERATALYPTAAAIDDAFHGGFVAWMQDTFGPYPYGTELRLVIAPTYWSGFEHPGNIVLDNSLANPNQPSAYTRPVAHVLNHEIAHQWAGDETTLADRYDFVWKEAMAEYLAYVYEDMNNPAEALATARAWKSFAVGALYHPVPEDNGVSILEYYGEVYGPGPMILFRQLESLSSRAQVLAGIATVLGTQRALSVAEVQAALETSTGLDLDTYFDIWVRGAGPPVWPTFRTELSGAPPNQMVTVTETTPGGVLHGCDFAVEIRGANAGEVAKVNIERGVNGQLSVAVNSGVPWVVTQTVLDPDAQCLAFAAAPAFTVPRLHPPGWSPWRGSLAP